MRPQPRFVVPGHGKPSTDVAEEFNPAREYVGYVRDAMGKAVDNFTAFDEAYRDAD